MKSTVQNSLGIIQNGLQFYYDVANKHSYSKLSNITNNLYNIAKEDNYILIESGSSADFGSALYQNDFYGTIKTDTTSHIQSAGIIDITGSNTPDGYTLQFIINPFEFHPDTSGAPTNKNYIFKSDSDYGIYLKYTGDTNREIEVGINGAQLTKWDSEMISQTNNIYFYTITFNGNDEIRFFSGQGDDNGATANTGGGYAGIHNSFKIGYNFNLFYFYGFIMYNRILTGLEIENNINQIKNRYGNLFNSA